MEKPVIERCDQTIIHEDVVERVCAEMAPEEILYEVSELFRVFGDSTRARIVNALSLSEMCVCDLAALLGLTQSAVSHQLRVLRSARLVTPRRMGKVVYYALADDHVRDMFKMAFEHVQE